MFNKFCHSVKVPRLYKVAATVAKQFSEGVGSIKDLVYGGKKKHPNLKALYSLVTTLYKKTEEIENLLKRSKILEKESRCDPWLTKILIVELLWGKGALAGQSKPENTVRGYEQIFKAHLTEKPGDKQIEGPLKPRYVRVNTLSITTDEAIQNFQDEDCVLTKFLDKNDYDGFLQKISALDENEFMVDIHIPNLLIFPPKTEFHNHPAYIKGSILLQDKASCLPVHILAPPSGSVVLDMCAAPGMKTTHIAAILKDTGTVYAVEKDPKRFKILENMIADSKATCVKTLNKDVLDCSKEDFPGVEYILVDPSCTGSGIAERYYSDEKIAPERLQKLAGFQIKILRAALTKYPDVKKVVYSTCSVLPEENEDVVRQVLETNYNFKLVPAKQFVSGTWKNFGSPDYGELGAYCLYTRPDDDFTNGFFVAVFERLAEGEENKFFNHKIYSYKRTIDKKERKKAKRLERERLQNEQNYTDPEPFNTNGEKESTILDVEDCIKDGETGADGAETTKTKKKKKKRHLEIDNELTKNDIESIPNYNNEDYVEYVKKSKKKKQKLTEALESDTLTINNNIDSECIEEISRKKKKKNLLNDDREIDENAEVLQVNDEKVIKKNKKKKRKLSETEQSDVLITNNTASETVIEEKLRKKKKKKHTESIELINGDSDNSVIVMEVDIDNNFETNESADIVLKKKKNKKKNKDSEIIQSEELDAIQKKEKHKSKKKTKHEQLIS